MKLELRVERRRVPAVRWRVQGTYDRLELGRESLKRDSERRRAMLLYVLGGREGWWVHEHEERARRTRV